MDSSFKPALQIFSYLIAFFLAWHITNSLDIIRTGAWSGFANILIFYPMYATIFVVIISLLIALFSGLIKLLINNDQTNLTYRLPKLKNKKKKSFTTRQVLFYPVILVAGIFFIIVSFIDFTLS